MLAVARPLVGVALDCFASHRGGRISRAVALLTVLYLALALPCHASLQTSVIFPGHSTQGQPEAQLNPPPGSELIGLRTSRGERIVALFGAALTPEGLPHPSASARPTILFFYGNAMCLSKSMDEFEGFRRLGANVLIPEFVGYGLSEGQPSETGCYETADAAHAYLLTRGDVDRRRIVAAGWSLGAAVALDLASREPIVISAPPPHSGTAAVRPARGDARAASSAGAGGGRRTARGGA